MIARITKSFLFQVWLLTFCSCATLKNYPLTDFYVKNLSNTPIAFEVSIIKRSTIFDSYEMSVPFLLQPNDSVLARRIGFKKDAGYRDRHWFIDFEIFPQNGVKISDPFKFENWKPMKDIKGQVFYTFTIAE